MTRLHRRVWIAYHPHVHRTNERLNEYPAIAFNVPGVKRGTQQMLLVDGSFMIQDKIRLFDRCCDGSQERWEIQVMLNLIEWC